MFAIYIVTFRNKTRFLDLKEFTRICKRLLRKLRLFILALLRDEFFSKLFRPTIRAVRLQMVNRCKRRFLLSWFAAADYSVALDFRGSLYTISANLRG